MSLCDSRKETVCFESVRVGLSLFYLLCFLFCLAFLLLLLLLLAVSVGRLSFLPLVSLSIHPSRSFLLLFVTLTSPNLIANFHVVPQFWCEPFIPSDSQLYSNSDTKRTMPFLMQASSPLSRRDYLPLKSPKKILNIPPARCALPNMITERQTHPGVGFSLVE